MSLDGTRRRRGGLSSEEASSQALFADEQRVFFNLTDKPGCFKDLVPVCFEPHKPILIFSSPLSIARPEAQDQRTGPPGVTLTKLTSPAAETGSLPQQRQVRRQVATIHQPLRLFRST